MGKVKLKRVRRICGVKGCRNTHCYTLTAAREFGMSVIMCGDCIRGAYERLCEMEGADGTVVMEQDNPSTADAVPLPLGKGGYDVGNQETEKPKAQAKSKAKAVKK